MAIISIGDGGTPFNDEGPQEGAPPDIPGLRVHEFAEGSSEPVGGWQINPPEPPKRILRPRGVAQDGQDAPFRSNGAGSSAGLPAIPGEPSAKAMRFHCLQMASMSVGVSDPVRTMEVARMFLDFVNDGEV